MLALDPRKKPRWALVLVLAGSVVLGGCDDDDDDAGSTGSATSSFEPASMTILHINDHHSHLSEDSLNLSIAGTDYEVTSGGFPRVVALFDQLEARHENVLKLHAGDAVTGTLFYTLFQGEADAAMMNEICFDAFALGNHEFDDGDAGLQRFLDHIDAGTCQTPALAANVTPQVGTPLAPAAADDYIRPWTIERIGDVEVGIIGIDIKGKTQNSSSPLPTTAFADEIPAAAAAIDELRARGIEHIVLLTHQGYDNDLAMANALPAVDVIVGGDSHTLLGDFESYGLNVGGPYPTRTTNADGDTTCVVQAWQYAQAVGELTVDFDGEGRVTDCDGTAHLMIDAPVTVDDREIAEGDPAWTALMNTVANTASLDRVAPDPEAAAALAGYAEEVDVLMQDQIGTAAENLCLERIPGQGRSTLCSAESTLPHGGDIQTLVAHAFREMSLRSDIAIQNAGGVRIDIPAGPITIGTAYELLPFSNTLVELTMTGEQIHAVLEDATDFALDGSTGAYPYAAGLRWDMDLSAPRGSRLSNLEFKGRDAAAWQPLDPAARYVVVTNDYIAGGKDGYTTFESVGGDDRVDTFLDYAQSFVDYVEADADGLIEKLPYSEYSTQDFITADGQRYPSTAR